MTETDQRNRTGQEQRNSQTYIKNRPGKQGKPRARSGQRNRTGQEQRHMSNIKQKHCR
jgi:hypothetical protein